jgi:DnaJ-class molecular chaperone
MQSNPLHSEYSEDGVSCPRCGGMGAVELEVPIFDQETGDFLRYQVRIRNCPDCGGTGYVDDLPPLQW